MSLYYEIYLNGNFVGYRCKERSLNNHIYTYHEKGFTCIKVQGIPTEVHETLVSKCDQNGKMISISYEREMRGTVSSIEYEFSGNNIIDKASNKIIAWNKNIYLDEHLIHACENIALPVFFSSFHPSEQEILEKKLDKKDNKIFITNTSMSKIDSEYEIDIKGNISKCNYYPVHGLTFSDKLADESVVKKYEQHLADISQQKDSINILLRSGVDFPGIESAIEAVYEIGLQKPLPDKYQDNLKNIYALEKFDAKDIIKIKITDSYPIQEGDESKYLQGDQYCLVDSEITSYWAKKISLNNCSTDLEKIERIRYWCFNFIVNKGGGYFNTSDQILSMKVPEGDCGNHGVLLCTFLRKYKFPSRLVYGLLHISGYYTGHAWVEVLVDRKWKKVDCVSLFDYSSVNYIRFTELTPESIFSKISEPLDIIRSCSFSIKHILTNKNEFPRDRNAFEDNNIISFPLWGIEINNRDCKLFHLRQQGVGSFSIVYKNILINLNFYNVCNQESPIKLKHKNKEWQFINRQNTIEYFMNMKTGAYQAIYKKVIINIVSDDKNEIELDFLNRFQLV